MRIKNKKKFVFIILLTILIMIIPISVIISINYKNSKHEVILTQLEDHGSRQMMGYILRTKNKTIVIDGGLKEDSENLIDNIKQLGTGKVDTWFITHPHSDHAEAFMEIVENTDIEIDKIYVSLNDKDWYITSESYREEEIEHFFKVLENYKIKNKIEEVSLNQKMKFDNMNCEVLGIKNPEITDNAINNSSMVLKFTVNDKSILFLADTGIESGKKLLEKQKDKLKADIVQMAHHGQNGVDKEVYDEVKPEICLWPTPEWLWNNDSGTGYNSGPWKTLITRNWMEELGVKENYIEKDGTISIKIK